jgi:hypothetical protein
MFYFAFSFLQNKSSIKTPRSGSSNSRVSGSELLDLFYHLGPAGEEAVGIVEEDGFPVGDEVHLGLQAQYFCLLSA